MFFEVRKLKAWYCKGKNVLDGIDLKVEKGRVIAILGVNGAGKSTFLKTIVGLHKKFEGEIHFEGKSIDPANDLDAKRRRFYIGDEPELFNEMSALEFIKAIHVIYKKKLNLNRFKELIELFEFEKYVSEECKNLSLGNKQKVLIITALLLECEILILDEPLIGLDVMAIENFYKEIRKYAQNEKTVILSTHIIEIIDNICDEVFILDKGNIKESFKISKNVNTKERFFGIVKNGGDI